MKKEFKELKKVREIEATINRNLYIISMGLTLMTMAIVSTEFFSRGEFPNFNIDIFYLGVLIVYSLHKEIIRLMGKKNFRHHGEYFVYAWVVLTAGLYFVNFATKNYFVSQQSSILTDISMLTLEVMFVFIVTRVMKMLRVSYTIQKRK
jgi:hypothetical protein